MKKIIFLFLFFISITSCEILNKLNTSQTDNISRQDVINKFEKNFPEFFSDSVVTLTNFKKSPIGDLYEGAFLIKNQDKEAALYFLLSSDGNYFIFNPEIINVSGPIRNAKLMEEISLENIPFIGNPNADIVIVEYSDFQCPACKYAYENVIGFLKNPKYLDNIVIYFKHFPLSFHLWADDAAVFTTCIKDKYGNDKFWKAHDLIFDNQSKFSKDNFLDDIKSIMSDEESLLCLNSLENDDYASSVFSSKDEGSKIGVNSTPTFVINGYIVKGADLTKIIDAIEFFSK